MAEEAEKLRAALYTAWQHKPVYFMAHPEQAFQNSSDDGGKLEHVEGSAALFERTQLRRRDAATRYPCVREPVFQVVDPEANAKIDKALNAFLAAHIKHIAEKDRHDRPKHHQGVGGPRFRGGFDGTVLKRDDYRRKGSVAMPVERREVPDETQQHVADVTTTATCPTCWAGLSPAAVVAFNANQMTPTPSSVNSSCRLHLCNVAMQPIMADVDKITATRHCRVTKGPHHTRSYQIAREFKRRLLNPHFYQNDSSDIFERNWCNSEEASRGRLILGGHRNPIRCCAEVEFRLVELAEDLEFTRMARPHSMVAPCVAVEIKMTIITSTIDGAQFLDALRLKMDKKAHPPNVHPPPSFTMIDRLHHGGVELLSNRMVFECSVQRRGPRRVNRETILTAIRRENMPMMRNFTKYFVSLATIPWSWRRHVEGDPTCRAGVLALFSGVTFTDRCGERQFLPSEIAAVISSFLPLFAGPLQ